MVIFLEPVNRVEIMMKISNTPICTTDKTDKTPILIVLSVLSVVRIGVRRISERVDYD